MRSHISSMAFKFDVMSRRIKLWIVSTALGLSVPFTHAQSSVTVKVETRHGGEVPGVQVGAKRLAQTADKRVIEVLKLQEIEKKTYRTDQLTKGQYLVFACDVSLKYAPDLSQEFKLSDREPKKIPTLVLEDQSSLVQVSGATKGDKVCVIHRATKCKATMSVDAAGSIPIPGQREDYDYEPAASCM
jgi:hypothetical protein